MHRIDSANSVAGEFSNGTPPLSPGTAMDAVWFNAVQAELINVIEALAGITLIKNTNTQLGTALYVLFGRLAAANTWTQTQTFQAVTATSYGAMTGSSVNVGAGTVTAGAVNSSAPSTFQPSSAGTALHAVGVGAGNNGVFAESHNTGAAIRAECDSSGPAVSAAVTLGVAIEAQRGSQRGAINIIPTAGDPSSPSNGDIWYNSTTNTLKCYVNGAVKTFTVS